MFTIFASELLDQVASECDELADLDANNKLALSEISDKITSIIDRIVERETAQQQYKIAMNENLMNRALRLMVGGGLDEEDAFEVLISDDVDVEEAYLAVMSASIRHKDLLEHRKQQEKEIARQDAEFKANPGLGKFLVK